MLLEPVVKMVASETPVTSNEARPRERIGWLIEASECTEGEGHSDRPVIDTDEREETRIGASRWKDRILKQ